MNLFDSNSNVYITLKNEKLVQVKLVTFWEVDTEYDSSFDAEIVQQELADNLIFPVTLFVKASFEGVEAGEILQGVLVAHKTRNQDLQEAIEVHDLHRVVLESLETKLNNLLDKLA